MNPASVVRYKNSAASGDRNKGGVANSTAFAMAITAQIAQASLACRSESWPGAGCGVPGVVRLVADGIAGLSEAEVVDDVVCTWFGVKPAGSASPPTSTGRRRPGRP